MKLNKKITFLYSLSFPLFFLSGCGQGFETSLSMPNIPCINQSCSQSNPNDNTAPDNSDHENQDPTPLPPQNNWDWSVLKITSSIRGGLFDNTKSVSLLTTDPQVSLVLPLAQNSYISQFSRTLPHLNLTTLSNSNRYWFAKLNISLFSVAQSTQGATITTLPNGDQLPGLSGKSLTHEIININVNTKAHIYRGQGVLALYVESPYNPYFSQQMPLNRQNGKLMGHYVMIPAKNSHHGGFFISMTLTTAEVILIRENLEQ